MENLSSNQPFIHTSIRVRKELKITLGQEARDRGVSSNALINSILEKHVSFDRILDHVGAIPLNGPLFSKMLNEVPLEEMEKLGKELGPELIKRTFAFLGLSFDLENLIKSYFGPLSSYSRWYRFNISGSGRNRRLLFEHSHGPKWSAFLGQYIGGIIKSATGIEPRTLVEDSLVVILC